MVVAVVAGDEVVAGLPVVAGVALVVGTTLDLDVALGLEVALEVGLPPDPHAVTKAVAVKASAARRRLDCGPGWGLGSHLLVAPL